MKIKKILAWSLIAIPLIVVVAVLWVFWGKKRSVKKISSILIDQLRAAGM
jgi:hypothetical protein